MTNIILLAPPAAGKGTQAKNLSSKYELASISTGNLLREETKSGSLLGQKVAATMATGTLVEDSIVLDILKARIQEEDCQNGFILDGFPRNVNQAQELDTILALNEQKMNYVFLLEVPREILLKRISGRRQCSECSRIYNIYEDSSKPKQDSVCDYCGHSLFTRSDDKDEIHKTRFETYQEKTEPLIEYYEEQGVLYRINGDQRVEEITNQISSILEKR